MSGRVVFAKVSADAVVPSGDGPFVLCAAEDATLGMADLKRVRTGLRVASLSDGHVLCVTEMPAGLQTVTFAVESDNAMELCVPVLNGSLRTLEIRAGAPLAHAVVQRK